MALIKCIECGGEISDKAKVCPQCGTNKPKKSSNLFVPILIGFFLLLPVVLYKPSSSGNIAPMTTVAPYVPSWYFGNYKDDVGQGIVTYASIETTETFQLGFPYQGAQRAKLTIRKHPRWGKDVYLSIEKGQILCHSSAYKEYSRCRIVISIDGKKPFAVEGSTPADNDSTTVFLPIYGTLISKLKTSKQVTIAATIYQEGERAFTFNVAGFNWK